MILFKKSCYNHMHKRSVFLKNGCDINDGTSSRRKDPISLHDIFVINMIIFLLKMVLRDFYGCVCVVSSSM